jgi:hypothetical protein
MKDIEVWAEKPTERQKSKKNPFKKNVKRNKQSYK